MPHTEELSPSITDCRYSGGGHIQTHFNIQRGQDGWDDIDEFETPPELPAHDQPPNTPDGRRLAMVVHDRRKAVHRVQ